ncbi:MAG: DNA methyltransferase [Pseudomonadota bacterium]
MAELNVVYVSPAALKPRATNPRTHSRKQIRQIAESIKTFGFTNPVLLDARSGIIAGHGRVAAAELLGLEKVPTIRLEDLSEAQIRAYVIADNRLAELAGWDDQLLALELQGIAELDLEFDLTLTGLETPEIDILIDGLNPADDKDPDDEVPEVAPGPAVTRLGDLWRIGEHRLLCGDATEPEVYERLLEGDRAQMVFTDPPYNVPINGHVSGLGKVHHREFAMARGEMSAAAFTGFLTTVFSELVKVSSDGAIHFVCMDWRHIGEVIAAGDAAYSEMKNLCVWTKTNGGMGSLYRSQHELVFVFKAGDGAHINNVELGRYGRYRTNVWSCPGINSFGHNRDSELALHPTVKPVALVADAIKDCSHRRGIVLDAFAGSGTTLLAAEKTGRRGYGIELNPHYCDVIIRGLAAKAKLEAVHAETERSFADVAREREEKVDVG